LEYIIHAWSLYIKVDIDHLERAPKLVSGFHKFTYKVRLHEMGLLSLQLRNNLIKIIIRKFKKSTATISSHHILADIKPQDIANHAGSHENPLGSCKEAATARERYITATSYQRIWSMPKVSTPSRIKTVGQPKLFSKPPPKTKSNTRNK